MAKSIAGLLMQYTGLDITSLGIGQDSNQDSNQDISLAKDQVMYTVV